MAILVPEVPDKATRSERMFLARLQRELDDECVVLHSLNLKNHVNKLWGEADFVVLMPKGIFILELKGCRVSCQNGNWRFTKINSSEYYEKTEGPFRQAETAMIAVRDQISDDPSFRKHLIGYGVVMPFERFTATGPEIVQEVLLDQREFNHSLKLYFGALSKYWRDAYEKKHGKAPDPPKQAEISGIRQLLRPDVASAYNLGSYLNGVDRELIQLTDNQLMVMRGIQSNIRTVVRGMAGTGKTVLAVDRVRQLAASGRKVLYLCFNRLLAEHVAENLQEDPCKSKVTVRTAHTFFREVIEAAGLSGDLRDAEASANSQHEFFSTVFPKVFSNALIFLDYPPIESIVIDEAQDLLTVDNLEAIDLLIQGGLKDGHWHLFLDPMQDIYGRASEEAGDLLAGINFATFDLTVNCRNTRPVAITTSIVSSIDLPLVGAVEGPEVSPIFCSGKDDLRAKIKGEIGRLLDHGIAVKDLILLSQRRLENSVLSGMTEICGLPIVDITGSAKHDAGLHFSTIHAFKGLERLVVLAVDLNGIGSAEHAMLHYAGLSRARTYLLPFFEVAEKSAYEAQTVEFGRRLVKVG